MIDNWRRFLFFPDHGKGHEFDGGKRASYILLAVILLSTTVFVIIIDTYRPDYVLNAEIGAIHHIDLNFLNKPSHEFKAVKFASFESPTISKPDVVKQNELAEGCLISIPEIDTGDHIVPPPPGDVTLVCCATTKGVMNIAVHPSWAPIGAQNFLNMVQSGFISSQIGMFRVLKGFLVQFGLAGIPEVQKSYKEKYLNGKWLKDDVPWLPQGPTGRRIHDISRYQPGYIAYAGAGNNSRGTQLIISYSENQFLGGGCPWEVPFGQLVGRESYRTLNSLYGGYGEKVSQKQITKRGNEYLKEQFPLLDYMLSCNVTAVNVPWKYNPR